MLDIEGQPLAITDARGNQAMQHEVEAYKWQMKLDKRLSMSESDLRRWVADNPLYRHLSK